MASFRCYDNSDVIATLIMTNFHLYLIQLWWQYFQMFVYGDVVYVQTWQVLTLKNCIINKHYLEIQPTGYVIFLFFFQSWLDKGYPTLYLCAVLTCKAGMSLRFQVARKYNKKAGNQTARDFFWFYFSSLFLCN